MILEQPMLDLIEVKMIEMCIRWAHAECIRNFIAIPKADNLRNVLGNLIYKFRYRSIDYNELMISLANMNIITENWVIQPRQAYFEREPIDTLFNMKPDKNCFMTAVEFQDTKNVKFYDLKVTNTTIATAPKTLVNLNFFDRLNGKCVAFSLSVKLKANSQLCLYLSK